MKKADVFEFFRRLAESNPAPETELEYVNPYTLLVAVALSAQATDVGVNKATRALFARVTTPQQMLDLGEEGLKQHIKTIGLYNTKAKNVIAAARILVDEFGGEILKCANCSRSYPAWAARPPMSCSTSPSAGPPLR